MKHRTARGKIAYLTERDGVRREFGREWFSVTEHEDGQRTLRALCEIEAGVVAPRDVVREVTYTVDRDFAPIDCFNRVHANGRYVGSGWLRFTPTEAECESHSVAHGRVAQRVALARPARSLASHPVSADAFHTSRFDRRDPATIQPQPDFWMTSLEHDGASAPLLASIRLRIEYCGRESVTTPVGAFDADHFRFLLSDSGQPVEHPTEDVWCLPESRLFVRATVGGYMAATFELVEYEGWE